MERFFELALCVRMHSVEFGKCTEGMLCVRCAYITGALLTMSKTVEFYQQSIIEVNHSTDTTSV